MRVLVTGGAGFIGSNLVYSLVSGGDVVGVIDDVSSGSVDNVHPTSSFIRMDIRDPQLPEAVEGFAPEAVIHLAAQVDVSVSIRDPKLDWDVNVEGTRAVARAARGAGARVLVSASSAAVYGEHSDLPLKEETEKTPTVPYGRSKLQSERVLIEELAGSETDFASFRFSNVYGPRQGATGEGGVIAIFADKLTAGESPTIYGSGKQTRDFIYVGDVVGAVQAALGFEGRLAGEGEDGPAYNVSTGKEENVEDVAEFMRRLAGFEGEFARALAREGDVARSSLDPGKAASVLGWHANVPIEGGLLQTVRWFARRKQEGPAAG